MTWAAELAARRRIHLLAGSFPERGRRRPCVQHELPPRSERLAAAAYRKVHLFDVQLAETEIRESATFAAGDELCVLPLAGHRTEDSRRRVLGLSICYDLRFPELFRVAHPARRHRRGRALRVHRGHRAGPLGAAPAGAGVENQVYVIGAGQVGRLPPGMPACHGHSMIVDPWGQVLAERPSPSPGVVVADLDFARLARIRAELPVLAHRRPDAYR